MAATAHQATKIEEVVNLINNGFRRIILSGEAGVGKTFVTTQLIDHYLKSLKASRSKWSEDSIYVTAPTNKALSILQGKVDSHPSIVFKTTHSALKYQRFIDDKQDKVSFKPVNSDRNPPFENCILAFVDECSMLESKMVEHTDNLNFPIIFVGDNAQLNPIGEPCSPVFTRSYPNVKLEEIVRQGEGNPIVDLSRNLSWIKLRESNITASGTGYMFKNDKTPIIENLAEVNGTDDLKYLAYMNDDVDSVNKAVRQRIYGRFPAKIELGETLVMDAPKGEHWINKEIKVEDVKIITEQISIPTAQSRYTVHGPTYCDKIKMRVYRINDDFNIVHEQSQGMYDTILKSIVSNCSTYGWSWKGKYFFMEQFGQTKYNHAITVHKSQGSTYQQAILNVGNVNKNRNADERKRMLYTGVTRAAKLLILNNV